MSERDRVSEIFLQACALPATEQSAFLSRECGDDEELRAEIESMLHADRQAEAGGPTMMKGAIGAVAAEAAATAAALRDKCGPYRPIRTLGEGGMGVVYLAEQEEPVRRSVALKLILPGLDIGEVLARFEAERQALAALDHPNIAKLLEAGTSAEGRPYFVMEYIDGLRLTDYCDRKELGTRQRLEIFLSVCEALDHAHRNGILHRDIKPSNVLVAEVSGRAVVKVIDFGVAKATNQRLSDKTPHTRLGQIIGTPEYMSPEQANLTDEGIDAGTDVYSLGVMLYELLTGRLPHDPDTLHAGGFGEMQRILREVEPPKPSTAIGREKPASGEAARARNTDPAGLQRQLNGDLDWIVMRALEKDRARRYPTAGELAEEIRRHLEHRPVKAGPPSLSYLLGKLVRRRPTQTALVLTLAVMLPLGGWLWLRSHERGLELNRVEAAQLVKRLSRAGRNPDKLLQLSDEILALDRTNAMAWRARAVAYFNRSRSATDDMVREQEREQAMEAADRVVALLPGASWPIQLKAYLLDKFGDGKAAAALREGIASAAPDSETDFFQAKLLVEQGGDLTEAQNLLTRSILVEETVHAVEERAWVRVELGDLDGALDDYRRLTQMGPRDFYPHWRIGLVRMRQGRYQDAEDQLQRARDLVSDADRWRVEELRADSFTRWSRSLVGGGQPAEALNRIRQAEEAARSAVSLAPEQPGPHVNLGASLVERYRLEEDADRALLDEGVEHYTVAQEISATPDFESERQAADVALANSCDAYLTLGDAEAALPYCVHATELLPDEPVVFYNLAGAQALLGRHAESLAALERDLQLGDTDHGYLAQDPWFEALRTDPAFQDLIARMDQAAQQR